MVGWYILGGMLLLLVGIWMLRVRAEIAFGRELCVMVQIGPKKLTILPKLDKPKKAKKTEKKQTKTAQQNEKPKEKKKFPFTFDDVRSVLPVIWEALQKALRKIQSRMVVDPLDVSIVFGGSDPVKSAQMYGWTGTAVWTIMPQLEQLIRIPHPHIHLDVDYDSCRIAAEGRVGVKFRVGDLLVIALTLAVPVLKWYLAWRRKKNAPSETLQEETKNG